MPNLDIDRYAQDMKAMAPLVTDAKPGGRRVQRVNSQALVDVNVVAGNLAVTMLLRESGLYVKGFRNAHGTWCFNGEGAPSELKFNCSYVGSGSIGIFTDANSETATRQRSKQNIVEAVRALAEFTGGNDLHLKVPLATMVFLISESLRFTIVYDRIVETCKGAGATFSFADLKEYVQNWEAMSAGGGPAGVLKNTVFTSHS